GFLGFDINISISSLALFLDTIDGFCGKENSIRDKNINSEHRHFLFIPPVMLDWVVSKTLKSIC
ncbi:MAG: hypothetical protein K8R49_06265, partial [Candidatus Cloacimonetes bacterium]|nr:hypothetical protein [Candidatus Cloacimonadota bacterium]